MKNKKFDSVKMMRDIRKELSKKYFNKPEIEMKDLRSIRSKYKLKTKQKSKH